MGGAPKPRRRLTPADCADRINELNADEQKMMLAILIKRQNSVFCGSVSGHARIVMAY